MVDTIILAQSKQWLPALLGDLLENANYNSVHVSNTDELLIAVERHNPKWVFFPHWSYYIPEKIYENHECVVFHMTDLPFGRGGSPLQNLIGRGIYETKISALRCVKALDAGPIYMKKALSLHGNAQEIYIRASSIIVEMINDILKNHPQPRKQQGEAVVFERRKPEESNIFQLSSLDKLHDYIRMLDADGYPKAYVETEHFKLEFTRSSYKGKEVIADVKFTMKGGDNDK